MRYESENDRIEFLKNVAKTVYDFSHLELNLRKIYRSDTHCIKELLKLATFLRDSKRSGLSNIKGSDGSGTDLSKINEVSFRKNVNEIRRLASDLTSLGLSLHEKLEDEVENQKERISVLSNRHTMDLDLIQRFVQKKHQKSEEMVRKLEMNMKQIMKDESDLLNKKQIRKEDLERANNRLHRLSNFRPLFMDEYEKREKQLKLLFQEYVEKSRNLDYLENEVEKFRLKEREQRERGLRKLDRIRKEIKDTDEENLYGVVYEKQSFEDLKKLENSPSSSSSNNIPTTTTTTTTGSLSLKTKNNNNNNITKIAETNPSFIHALREERSSKQQQRGGGSGSSSSRSDRPQVAIGRNRPKYNNTHPQQQQQQQHNEGDGEYSDDDEEDEEDDGEDDEYSEGDYSEGESDEGEYSEGETDEDEDDEYGSDEEI